MTVMRLTDRGRAAVADGSNRALRGIQIRSIAIGTGVTGGESADDALSALRTQRASAAATGSTTVAGRIAVRASYQPTASYAVREVGVWARVGDAGSDFLFAYGAVAAGADAIAQAVSGARLIVAVVIEVGRSAAAITVTVDAGALQISLAGSHALLYGSPSPAVTLTQSPQDVAVGSDPSGYRWIVFGLEDGDAEYDYVQGPSRALVPAAIGNSYQVLAQLSAGGLLAVDFLAPLVAARDVLGPRGMVGSIVGTTAALYEVSGAGLYRITLGLAPSRVRIGVGELTGQTSVQFDGAVIHGGILYAKSGDRLWSIALSTGTFIRLGDISRTGLLGLLSIGGHLYASRGASPGSLWRITPSTGTSQAIVIDNNLGDLIEPTVGVPVGTGGWQYGFGLHGSGRWRFSGANLVQEVIGAHARLIGWNQGRAPRGLAPLPAGSYGTGALPISHHSTADRLVAYRTSPRGIRVRRAGTSGTIRLREVIGIP